MSTPTSIGELSVGVTLDTSKMEAGLKGMERKLKAQGKQLDAEYSKIAGSGALGFGGGFVDRTRGRASSQYRQMLGGGGGVGGLAARFGRTVGGSMLGSAGLGAAGGAIAGAGPVGLAAAAIGIVAIGTAKLSTAARDFALQSGKLDATSLAAIRMGDSVDKMKKGLVDGSKEILVAYAGAARGLIDVLTLGPAALAALNASDRAAAQAAQRTARTVALNGGGTMADVLARRQASDARLRQFSRDQTFAGAAPKQQQNMLRSEIAALKAKEETARAAGKILEAEDLRFERLQKVAQLEKNIADFTEAQRQNNDAITRARLERIDADRQAEAERVRESRETLDAVLRATERDVLSAQLDRVRDRIGGARNPFEARSTGDFGSASASTANFAAEGNRLLNEMVRILRAVESNTEDALARN